MGFIAATCPNCSAHLEMDESANSCYCSYCGTLVERERVNINVSGYVKLDQSGRLGNYQRLADSAFKAANYGEAYNYYAKVLEIAISDPRAVLRKGLCAGYLSINSGAFRIVEVLDGYSSSLSLVGNDSDKKSLFTSDYICLAIAYASFYMKQSTGVFADNTALFNFFSGYQTMIGQLYDMYSRVPIFLSKQCEELLSFILHTCSFATLRYYCYSYVKNSSGPPTKTKKLQLMPKNARDYAKSIAVRCKTDYLSLPHIQQQSGRLNDEIAFHQGNIGAYENAYNGFLAANPQYVSQKRGITVGGTLLVILITAAMCFIVTGLGTLVTPVFLIAIPAAIVAACLIWKRMKANKLAKLDGAFLPAEIMQMREKSIASRKTLSEAKRKKVSLVLK